MGGLDDTDAAGGLDDTDAVGGLDDTDAVGGLGDTDAIGLREFEVPRSLPGAPGRLTGEGAMAGLSPLIS